MATLNPGDLDCTAGIAKRIYDQVRADARNGFSSPLLAAQTGAIKALCYAEAKGVADEINAAGGVGGGGGGSVPGLYWAPPTVANARDEEFDAPLSSAWTAGWTYDPTPVDPSASFTTDHLFRGDANVRPSWVRVQPGANSRLGPAWSKAITPLPANFVVWARMSVIWNGSVQGNNAVVGLYLRQGATANQLMLYQAAGGGGYNIKGRSIVDGGADTTTTPVGVSEFPTMIYSLGAIQVTGTSARFWVGTDHGDWRTIGSVTAAAVAWDTVGLYCGNASSVDFNSIMAWDFIRFLETSNWPQ